MTNIPIIIPTWLLLVSCAGELPGAPTCVDTSVAITLEEGTELGFSGADLLVVAEGEFDGLLTWYGDEYAYPPEESSTPVYLSVGYAAGEVRYVASELVHPEGDGPTMDLGIVCDDRVEVDVSLVITTEDGGLDEDLTLALRSSDGVRVRAGLVFDHSTLDGSYDYTLEHPLEVDSVIHSLEVSFVDTGCSGELVARAEGCHDGHSSWDDCTTKECNCWSSTDTVASWPADGSD